MTVDGKTVKGRYGPPRYYPNFEFQTCGDDERLRPAWIGDDHQHLFRTKRGCCDKLFGWIGDPERCPREGGICRSINVVREASSLTRAPRAGPSAEPMWWP